MSRLLLVALGILTSVSALYGQDPVPQRHIERVEVPRVLIDARVVDGRGFPIRGLAAGDFRVTIDGKPARVESAFWSGEQREVSGEAAPAGVATALPPEAKGRLIVFLFQKDMDVSRLLGLMRMLIRTRLFLDSLGPDDRVAVLSFDSHLKVWVDFTSDLDRVRHIFDRGILFENPPRLAASPGPSLLATLDVVQGRKAFTIEKGLALLGRALEPLPGSKSVVMVGHGFGELVGGNTVFVDQAYAEARRSLQAARATVFSLDVTDADAHTMEVGLKTTAADTGGFFARTHQFPGQAIERLAGALAGHYVLFVEVEQALERSRHEIAVTLAEGVKGEVLAKRHYSSRN